MFKCGKLRVGNIKIVMQPIILSLMLLVPSMSLHANTGEETGAITNEQVSNEDTGLKSAAQPKSVQSKSVRSDFPGWPERQQTDRKSKIPPPPPGPYMSTALSIQSIRGASFEKNRDNNSERRAVAKDDSNDRFSPDRPWPSNLRSPSRWKPENGYQFVGDQMKNKVYTSSMNNRHPTREVGYHSDARMSHPGNWVRKHPGVNPDMQRRRVHNPESLQMNPATRVMPYQGERRYAYPPGYRGGSGSNAVYKNPTNQSQYPMQGER